MKCTIAILLIFLVSSCGKLTDEELWIKVEQAKANNNWDSTAQVCQRLITEYPASKYAAWARFGLAESYRFRNQPRQALDNYKIYYQQHPDKQPSALSLFLIGYIYNNTLHMKDSAKYFYEKFLKQFPHHDLAPSVRFELETLGLAPNEALELKQDSRKRAARQ